MFTKMFMFLWLCERWRGCETARPLLATVNEIETFEAATMADDITKLDLYGILGVTKDATEKEVMKKLGY